MTTDKLQAAMQGDNAEIKLLFDAGNLCSK